MASVFGGDGERLKAPRPSTWTTSSSGTTCRRRRRVRGRAARLARIVDVFLFRRLGYGLQKGFAGVSAPAPWRRSAGPTLSTIFSIQTGPVHRLPLMKKLLRRGHRRRRRRRRRRRDYSASAVADEAEQSFERRQHSGGSKATQSRRRVTLGASSQPRRRTVPPAPALGRDWRRACRRRRRGAAAPPPPPPPLMLRPGAARAHVLLTPEPPPPPRPKRALPSWEPSQPARLRPFESKETVAEYFELLMGCTGAAHPSPDPVFRVRAAIDKLPEAVRAQPAWMDGCTIGLSPRSPPPRPSTAKASPRARCL